MLNKKGFTLVELLLVIIIISVLSGVVISVVNTSALRARARDSQRKSDLSKIQTALELYYTDNRNYPPSPSGNWMDVAETETSNPLRSALVSAFIDVLPNDPSYNMSIDDPCNRDGNSNGVFDYRYNYRTPSTGAPFYILTALMENATSDDESKCDELTNWSASTCGGGGATCGCTSGDSYQGTLDYCYGVQNPF